MLAKRDSDEERAASAVKRRTPSPQRYPISQSLDDAPSRAVRDVGPENCRSFASSRKLMWRLSPAGSKMSAAFTRRRQQNDSLNRSTSRQGNVRSTVATSQARRREVHHMDAQRRFVCRGIAYRPPPVHAPMHYCLGQRLDAERSADGIVRALLLKRQITWRDVAALFPRLRLRGLGGRSKTSVSKRPAHHVTSDHR